MLMLSYRPKALISLLLWMLAIIWGWRQRSANLVVGNNTKQQQQEQTDAKRKRATVIGMAFGYGLNEWKRFVGSLRKTGYTDDIILGVVAPLDKELEEYARRRNVIVKLLHYTPCIHNLTTTTTTKDQKMQTSITTCLDPYPQFKIRWSKYPLARDWLLQLLNNRDDRDDGPVFLTDVRDVLFQLNPFEILQRQQENNNDDHDVVYFFQEHAIRLTNHWIVQHPLEQCIFPFLVNNTNSSSLFVDAQFQQTNQQRYSFTLHPMLCSGTTMTTSRRAMLIYLNRMIQEMQLWSDRPQCRQLLVDSDDQAIHNYIYYYAPDSPYVISQQQHDDNLVPWQQQQANNFDKNNEGDKTRRRQKAIQVVSVPNRRGLVYHVGTEAMELRMAHVKHLRRKYGMSRGEALSHPLGYNGNNDNDTNNGDWKSWIPKSYNMTDAEGFFVNNENGKRIPIVHMYDRFHALYMNWLNRQDGLIDV